MPLPEGVTLTKKGRRICEYLDTQPSASIMAIKTACDVSSNDTVIRWRNYYRACNGDWSEAPPPTVRHRVDTQDPARVFGPPPERPPDPPPEPTPQPSESDTSQQEQTDPEPPSGPPAKKGRRELIF